MEPRPTLVADPAAAFQRWTWCRAVLHRGWWLVTSVYLVVDAHLSAAQLVLVGVAQGAVALVFEVPAGVVADTVSRKWSLVVSHALMGTAMIATGLVSGFGPLVATQMLWGLAWTFASGADVAWISDELDDAAATARALLHSGRAQLTGAVAGMLGVGALAFATTRSTAMVFAGAAMLLLGVYVVVRFKERRFAPTAAPRPTLARAFLLVRGNRVLLALFAATLLVNGVASAFGRLYPLRLVDVGLPGDPVAWFAVLGVLTYLAGAAALRLITRNIEGGYLGACAIGAFGAVALAVMPEPLSASAAVVLTAGALPLARTFGTIWVNRHATTEVRATVHSLLAQSEYLGGIACGLVAASVAGLAGLPLTLVVCGALLAVAMLLVGHGTMKR